MKDGINIEGLPEGITIGEIVEGYESAFNSLFISAKEDEKTPFLTTNCTSSSSSHIPFAEALVEELQ